VLIARGVHDGRIAAEVDPALATAALLGAIFYRRLMTAEPLEPEEARRHGRARPVALTLAPARCHNPNSDQVRMPT
jgi:tetracycline repressor-like protein